MPQLGAVLGRIVWAAANGDAAELQAVQGYLAAMAGAPQTARLARVLRGILDGSRDPALAAGLDDPVSQAIAVTVLRYVR